MFLTKFNCVVCADKCPAHTSQPLEILENGAWKYHLEISDKPSYFMEDKMFCSPECVEKWHKKENRI